MTHETVIPAVNAVGAIGFLTATGLGIRNYRMADIEKPFWLAFSFTAGLGVVWLTLVALEWAAVSSVTMNRFSTSLQAVIIGLYAIAVIGAHMIVRDLERSRTETEQRAAVISVLSRVLRHNLRNDLTVIRGYVSMIEGRSDDIETVRNTIDKLLTLSEKARELDRIVATDFEQEPTDLVALLEDIVDSIEGEYPSASISLYGEEVLAAVTPSFRVAIEELIENAAKHGGERPAVTVDVTAGDDTVEIRIADDGSGLDDLELELLQTETESQLAHGKGLGLWIANWIVTSHNGSVSATVSEDGTTMTVTIPQRSVATIPQRVTRLARTSDQYHAAFEEAHDAMVIIDDDDRIVDANKTASEIYGVDSRELLGWPLSEFLPDGSAFEEELSDMQAKGGGCDTMTIVDADGITRRVEYSATPDIVPGHHLLINRTIAE